jgi:hypothetical protein
MDSISSESSDCATAGGKEGCISDIIQKRLTNVATRIECCDVLGADGELEFVLYY